MVRIPTPEQWKYQSLAEALVEMICRDPDLVSQPKLLEEIILHNFDKVYILGTADLATTNKNISAGMELGVRIARPAISFTDLSEIPEIFERMKARWKEGICH